MWNSLWQDYVFSVRFVGDFQRLTPLNFEKVSKKMVTKAWTFLDASSVVLTVSP
jgi:predicted ThiF/HesA family dinucleotide-utilizing enzyme